MSQVEFPEEKAYNASLNRRMANTPVRGLSALPIRLGLAKDESGANMVLIGVALLFTLLTIGIFVFGGRSSVSSPVPPPGALSPVEIP